METTAGTYIFIGDIADYISGAPIYQRNKALFLSEKGWRVLVIPIKRGRVYIKDLSRFAVGSFPFLKCRPSDLRRRDLEECLNLMTASIGEVQGPCIVETGTDWSAYWGEILAERISAKHFVFILDEINPHINRCPDYFWWKYERGELAGISGDVVKELFGEDRLPNDIEPLSFSPYCTNSIEDYSWSGAGQWSYWDLNIGSIGRLEKKYVIQICDSIRRFAISHPEIQIGAYFFGGSDDRTRESVEDGLRGVSNLHVYITGYLWPLPLNVLRKMQVFVGGAGGARVPVSIGIPSLCMDIYGNGCIGFFDELDSNGLSTLILTQQKVSLEAQLEKVLRGEKKKFDHIYDADSKWQVFCDEFNRQLSYVTELAWDGLYWCDLKKIPHKKFVPRAGLRILGLKRFLALRAKLLRESVIPIDSEIWRDRCR